GRRCVGAGLCVAAVDAPAPLGAVVLLLLTLEIDALDVEHDAPVARPSLRRLVRRPRQVLTVSDRDEALAVDAALRRQELDHRLGPQRRQLLVPLRGTRVVRVPLDGAAP